ncbi:MAG TPA: chemotaxis protein CheC, partial [Solirubrobacteraceae bacterium]|nr:chemotaxis protein CheC [Solirubrobacteraceae bacterium]
MPDQVHLLVVRAGGLPWALPMAAVEQTFDLREHKAHRVGDMAVVCFRDQVLELIDLAERLGLTQEAPSAAVVVWASGRRRAFAIEEPVGQVMIERLQLPDLATGGFTSEVVLSGDEIIPILEPGAVAGDWSLGEASGLGFTDLQQSALREIANIGSGHAATALSQLVGRPVDISYSEALLTVLAEAIDKIGAPMSRSALVDTPIQADGGTVLLVFPDDTGEQLCQLLGTSLSDEIGLTALQEVGNILATSYLNAIVEMTGMELEPEPPTVEVDLLGELLSQSAASGGNMTDPTVLMRSQLTVEASTAKFSFLFVPRIGSVETLLDRLGVG